MIDRVFHQVLSELLLLNQQIHLQLPANSAAIQYQLRQISQALHQLQDIEEQVYLRFGRGGSRTVQHYHHRLIMVIDILRQRIRNLLLLAEEFETDPEGTIACLRRLEDNVQAQFHRLEARQKSIVL